MIKIDTNAIEFFTTPWERSDSSGKNSLVEKVGFTILAILATLALGIIIPLITCWIIKLLVAPNNAQKTDEVKEIAKEMWGKILETLTDWKEKSNGIVTRMLKERSINPLTKAGNQLYKQFVKEPIIAQLKHHSYICLLMELALENASGIKSWDTILVCDIEERTQSIAFYSSKENKLEYLVTNHDNLPLEFNENQVRGTASKIMKFLIDKSILTGRNLTLVAIPSAESFYEKHGFVNSDSGKDLDGQPMIYKVPQLLATLS